jgi:predicted transcriptional regulator
VVNYQIEEIRMGWWHPRQETIMKKISEVMTRDAKLITPDDTVQQAAKLMKDCDCGVLPVAEGDRLVDMITDRYIAALRCGGQGPGLQSSRRDKSRGEITASRIRTYLTSART